MKSILLSAFILTSLATSAFAENDQLKADRESVNSACTAESTTAGCGSEKVGSGLLKCIRTYKKDHKKDFTISEGCKSAMKKLRQDRREKNK